MGTVTVEEPYMLQRMGEIELIVSMEVMIDIDMDYGADADGNRGMPVAFFEVGEVIIKLGDLIVDPNLFFTPDEGKAFWIWVDDTAREAELEGPDDYL